LHAKGELFAFPPRPAGLLSAFVLVRGETRRSSEELSMRNTTHSVIASTIALAALIPSMAGAQVRQTTAARSPGSGQPWQCNPSDSVRAFNRAPTV
jgi:hypothetical protein